MTAQTISNLPIAVSGVRGCFRPEAASHFFRSRRSVDQHYGEQRSTANTMDHPVNYLICAQRQSLRDDDPERLRGYGGSDGAKCRSAPDMSEILTRGRSHAGRGLPDALIPKRYMELA